MLVKVLAYLAIFFFFVTILAIIYVRDCKKVKADKIYKEENK